MIPDNINERVNKAKKTFGNGFNCAQSVITAWSDHMEINHHDLLKLTSGLGYGMGGERTVCGAITGGILVIGSTIEDPAERIEVYDKVYYLIHEFKKKNSNKINCFDLVGENPEQEAFDKQCPIYIETVVSLLDRILR